MTVQAAAAACRELLEASYRRFFFDMEIDPETGVTPRQTARKFAAYPYIGSRYGTDPDVKKLLVVGLDIGSDETPGRLQHFEERRRAIELKPLPELNAHIAGTYFTALKYACPVEEWTRIRDRDQTCKTILKDGFALKSNPLSYIALTNFYKWVTEGRENKGGASDRRHVSRHRERELFLDEVRLLTPHVIVFQSAEFRKPWFRGVRDSIAPEVEWHVLEHPSRRGSRRPRDVTHPRLSSAPPTEPSDETHRPPQPARTTRGRVKQTTEIGSYRGLFRDDALVQGLVALGGQNRAIHLEDVVAHVVAHGYAGPRGGRGSAISFACRWLAKHRKPVSGFVITAPRRGYYRLEEATKAQIAAWESGAAEDPRGGIDPGR